MTQLLDLDTAAALLEANEDFRVLRRFVPRRRYQEEPWNLGDGNTGTRLALYVDGETTGLDRENDQLIEFAAVPFTYDATSGVVYEVLDGLSYFEEPTIPIPLEVQELTGITPDMVRGQRINDEAVNELLERAALVIAHNASFDRPIMERRLRKFADVHWACSQRDVPWQRFGCVGAKLENVLLHACREFYDAHRALDDCRVGVHCLAAATLEGRTAMAHLLESARQPTVRIWALDSPFPKKEQLKSHRPRFEWSDGSRMRKGWYVDVKPDQVEAEVEWLLVEIYGGRRREEEVIVRQRFGSRYRYSARCR